MPRKFSYELLIDTGTHEKQQYEKLTSVPQVHYLRDGQYHIDFGIQQLYLSDVVTILVVRHEEEVIEVPEVKIEKEKK